MGLVKGNNRKKPEDPKKFTKMRRNETKSKYEATSYKHKKIEAENERKFKRELGIKARYKKILRKQQEESTGNSQSNKLLQLTSTTQQGGASGSEDQDILGKIDRSNESENKLSQGWTVSSADAPDLNQGGSFRTAGWNVISPNNTKSEASTPQGWTPRQPGGPRSAPIEHIPTTDGSISTLNKASFSNDDQQQNPDKNINWRADKNPRPSGSRDGKQFQKSRGSGTGRFGADKPSSLKKAQNSLARKQQEMAEKAAMYEKRQKEREIALKNRKHKRLEKFKVLSQKTPKGQPVMKGRMQLLLQKIQSSL